MSLKNENNFYYLFVLIFFLFTNQAHSNTDYKIEVLNYLNELENFSASFIQTDGENLSEGKVYIGEKRIRAEYYSPTKILIILDKDRAMYYDYELEEDEFFNPKNTNAWFFYDVFRNPIFFEDSLIAVKKNELKIEKVGENKEGGQFLIRIYFEKNPLILRAIEVVINNESVKLSIYNHNHNEEYDEEFFKLISPKLLN